MVWSQEQINTHLETNKLLCKIKDSAFDFIRSKGTVSELQVQKYVIAQFKEHGLVTTKFTDLIVAFDENAANPHYRPKKSTNKFLEKKGIVMIDIWGRKKGTRQPYADITWMAVRGTIPSSVQHAFDTVLQARDKGVKFLQQELKKSSLPSGNQVHEVVEQELVKKGWKKAIKHSTGHSIGTISPHGRYGHLTKRHKKILRTNLGYTIEPGIYMDGKFGIRSEINFIIGGNKVLITGPVQKEWVHV